MPTTGEGERARPSPDPLQKHAEYQVTGNPPGPKPAQIVPNLLNRRLSPERVQPVSNFPCQRASRDSERYGPKSGGNAFCDTTGIRMRRHSGTAKAFNCHRGNRRPSTTEGRHHATR